MARKAVVLAAPEAARLLKGQGWNVEECLLPESAAQALKGAAILVVGAVDAGDLPLVAERVGVPLVTEEEFLAEPERFLALASLGGGKGAPLPPVKVLFTGYTGGAGKSTLAREAALFAARTTPTLLVEAALGASPLLAEGMVDSDAPGLLEMVRGRAAVVEWQKVRVLHGHLSYTLHPDQVEAALPALEEGSRVVIYDASPAHPLFGVFLRRANVAVVVAEPRATSVADARLLLDSLARSTCQAVVVMNKMRRLSRLAVAGSGLPPYAAIPFRDPPRDLGRPLWKAILEVGK